MDQKQDVGGGVCAAHPRALDRQAADTATLAGLLPGRAAVIVVEMGAAQDQSRASWTSVTRFEDLTAEPGSLRPESVPFDHPLWVLFSSGTTAVRNESSMDTAESCFEHLKAVVLQANLGSDDGFFRHTALSRMMRIDCRLLQLPPVLSRRSAGRWKTE